MNQSLKNASLTAETLRSENEMVLSVIPSLKIRNKLTC